MTKTDLIIALGKIDEKYISKAFEKATAEYDRIFDDKETQERVGIMDKKKYIKSKIVPIVTVAASVMLCVGTLIYITLHNNDDKITPQDNGAVTSQSEISDSSTDNSENSPDCDYVVVEPYKTYDDAVEQFLLDAQQNNDDLLYSARVNGVDGVYIYSLKNLPEGYNEEDFYGVEDIHYYNDEYNNADSNEQALKHLVIFNWYNDQSFEDTIKGMARFCISNGIKFYPVKNIPNCYCAVYGSYQEFYWENDGYCFNLRLPTYIGSISTARFEYNGQNVFELEKTFYAFDNSVEIASEVPASEEKYKCCDIEEIAPIDDGENLYFGARVTAWHPWDCDFALQVSVHNAANTTSLANFVLTDWAENLSFGESAELQVTFGVDEIPENTTISCKVITYYKVDDAEHEGISKYLGSHSYKKQNQEPDGITITTEMLKQFYKPVNLAIITSYRPTLSDISALIPLDNAKEFDNGLVIENKEENWNFAITTTKVLKYEDVNYMFFFSDTLYSSDDFSKIETGMTQDEVKQIFPGFILTETSADDSSNMKYESEFVFENGKLGIAEWETVNGNIVVSDTYYSPLSVEESELDIVKEYNQQDT